MLAAKPDNLSFEAAATVPVSGMAALQALRDAGQLQAGQQVLINGASGGVGSYAVQIAKAMGGEVTAVCSTSKMTMVHSLGADHLIDYSQNDPTQSAVQYDLIIDAAAYRPVTDYQAILKPSGTYVLVGGSSYQLFRTLLLGPWLTRRMQRSLKVLQSEPNQADLMELKKLIEARKVTPAIERTYQLNEVPQAIQHLEKRQVKGKIAIAV